VRRLAKQPAPSHIRLVLTAKGLLQLAQLLAAAALVVGLAGFALRRTMPWFVCTAVAFTVLIAAALFIVDAST
jgi:4-hydroxybenzoate polyprenyltransferase